VEEGPTSCPTVFAHSDELFPIFFVPLQSGTGRDGIEEALRGRFCLTITDVGLSDMSGFDVIKAICPHKQMHFIIITTNDSQNLMVEARSCGASVLLKPFLPSEILQLIGTTLANSDS
jgi:DNA-binding response OmpR family regulator